MKIAEAGKIRLKEMFPPIKDLSEHLDKEQWYSIDEINWEKYDYRPDVRFSLAYSDYELFVKYYVTENFFKAEMTRSNQNVYEDSCVEFFVSPENDGLYYNFEFNALGTCLLGSGHGRTDSKRADPEIISRIRRFSSVGPEPVSERQGKFSWTLTVAIPFKVFFHHKVDDPVGKSFRVNFYKCGDKVKVPHYLTWNPVQTENPDFHRPEYFGLLKFL